MLLATFSFLSCSDREYGAEIFQCYVVTAVNRYRNNKTVHLITTNMSYRLCSTCRHENKGNPNRMDTLCKSLGDHLTHSELSSVIEHQLKTIAAKNSSSNQHDVKNYSKSLTGIGSQTNAANAKDSTASQTVTCNQSHNGTTFRSSDNDSNASNQSYNDNTYLKVSQRETFATDCKLKICASRPEIFSASSQLAPEMDHMKSKPSRKRKNVVRYTTNGYSASLASTKFGSDTLLALCAPQDQPQIRLTSENYREQIEDILKHLNRADLLPTLQRSRPLFKG